MPSLATRLVLVRDQVALLLGAGAVGPLLIDRGDGLLYDVERNITWLQDANYAATTGRTADGQLRWDDARQWVAGLRFHGTTGWRLPDARGVDGSGPRSAENCADGEIGHLFMVAATRMSPPDLKLTHFEPFTIYWYRNEASPTQAFAFKMTGLRQGPLEKDPWADIGAVADKVLAWPVHDGDVGGSWLSRLLAAMRTRPFPRT